MARGAAAHRAVDGRGRVPRDGLEPGSVWLDETGAVVLASPAARRWLDLLDAQARPGFAARPAGRPSDAWPRGADGAGRLSRCGSGAADGRWVRARAERITSAAGRPAGLAVVIDAARPGYVLPLAARAYRLTERELNVVRGVLNGLDTRSVAASLHISEYTVQDHLKSVFDKIGVRSRRELAHQFAVGLG